MSEVLDVWPILPVSLLSTFGESDQRWDNIVAALELEHSNRICDTKVLPIAHALMSLANPPTRLTEFLSPMGVQWGEHHPLLRLLAACQQDLGPFLPEKRNPSVYHCPRTPRPSSNDEFVMGLDEENPPLRGDPNHPGPDRTRYSFGQTDHYPVFIRDGEDLITADYICYKQDGEETYIEGTMGRNSPIYRKSLHTCPQPNPNLDNPRHIHNDHLHIFQPESTIKELVDCTVHALGDPGVTTKVTRYRSLFDRHSTALCRLRLTEEELRRTSNDVKNSRSSSMLTYVFAD
jgi:hypothetical protein